MMYVVELLALPASMQSKHWAIDMTWCWLQANEYESFVEAMLLREIEEGLVGNEYLLKETSEDRHRQKQQQTYSR